MPARKKANTEPADMRKVFLPARDGYTYEVYVQFETEVYRYITGREKHASPQEK